MDVVNAKSLIGTWTLLTRVEVTSDGRSRIDPILGADPIAYRIYDAAGHFAVQFMRRNRETADGTSGYDAYFGRYQVGADGMVTQALIGALSQGDVGKVVTRRCHIDGTELVIKVETTASDGQPVTRTLRWQRAT
jgi:hypothetical protein